MDRPPYQLVQPIGNTHGLLRDRATKRGRRQPYVVPLQFEQLAVEAPYRRHRAVVVGPDRQHHAVVRAEIHPDQTPSIARPHLHTVVPIVRRHRRGPPAALQPRPKELDERCLILRERRRRYVVTRHGQQTERFEAIPASCRMLGWYDAAAAE